MDIETVAMTIIAHSGDARTYAFQALEKAREGEFDQAHLLIDRSDEEGKKAHHTQTQLLVAEANGEKPEINILLIHSQDHLMTSMLAQELIREMILMYETNHK